MKVYKKKKRNKTDILQIFQVNFIKDVSGCDTQEVCTNVMRKLVSVDLGANTSMTGRLGKPSFEKSQLGIIIRSEYN